jgi:hypothetical protein
LADDDVELRCNGKPCLDPWGVYFHYLFNVFPVTQSPVIAVYLGRPRAKPLDSFPAYTGPDGNENRLILADSYDALLNAFSREAVPYLLPYADLAKDESWWNSQGVHFF